VRTSRADSLPPPAVTRAPADPAREEYQIERLRLLAKDANLDPDFAEKFLNFVIKEVIRHHEAIAKNKGA